MWYRESGKVKEYSYKGKSKPLKDHLQTIFPGANSVDLFYMADRISKLKRSDDDVARLLMEADLGDLFPRYENKHHFNF
jgi:hypothetical protein